MIAAVWSDALLFVFTHDGGDCLWEGEKYMPRAFSTLTVRRSGSVTLVLMLSEVQKKHER